ncbi:MAG: hypothetical protein ACETVR_00830 [Candidatus Bathyarchaeia archaeon]
MVNKRLLESTIIEMLAKNGAQEFSYIFKFLNDRFQNVDEDDLRRALMNLELRGILRVYPSLKDKQRVELVRG